MEIDDDFGDLYSDVLLPVPSDSSKPPSPPSNPNPSPGQILAPPPPNVAAASSFRDATSVAAAPAVDDDDDWLLGRAAPATVDPPSNWADEDEETNANPSTDEKSRASALSPEKTVQEKNQTAVTADVADQEDPLPIIPGLEAAVGPTESDDWDDSDSEDDLQIVLNDTEHGAMDDLGYGDGDEEEDLVIVTNDDQIGAMDQDWGEEGAAPAGEGEGKEGDGSKVAGVGGAGGAGPSRIGYSNHTFHQHHSMYKYVRPGAPVPGGPAGSVAGPQGQLRPPLPTGPYPGRGRGDWRPAGGRMMNGRYGMSAWGNQMRPSGLDFSLPPQKTIFDFDIENFEEKPWRYPGAESSDYFNFNLDEAGWKDYCKRLASFLYYLLKIHSSDFSYLSLSRGLLRGISYAPRQCTLCKTLNNSE